MLPRLEVANLGYSTVVMMDPSSRLNRFNAVAPDQIWPKFFNEAMHDMAVALGQATDQRNAPTTLQKAAPARRVVLDDAQPRRS